MHEVQFIFEAEVCMFYQTKSVFLIFFKGLAGLLI